MIYDGVEFNQALTKVRQKHDHVCKDMAMQILEEVERFRNEGNTFPHVIRLALDSKKVRFSRDAYKSLIGIFYGRRGQYQRRRGLPATPHYDQVAPEPAVNSVGQYELPLT